MTNPLLADWDTPFRIAPFDRISDADFAPAFEEALAALERIVGDLERGDVPLDRSIRIYERGEKLKNLVDREAGYLR